MPALASLRSLVNKNSASSASVDSAESSDPSLVEHPAASPVEATPMPAPVHDSQAGTPVVALPVAPDATAPSLSPRKDADDVSVSDTVISKSASTAGSVRERVMEAHPDLSGAKTSEDKFHGYFGNGKIAADDILIEDYRCALQKDILVQGRMFVSEQNLSFRANIFGWETTVVVPWDDIETIEKAFTAKVIANAIEVTTKSHTKYFFSSYLKRDDAFHTILTVWRHVCPDAAPSPEDEAQSEPEPPQLLAFLSREKGEKTPAQKIRDEHSSEGGGHPPTTYDGPELKNVAMDEVLGTSPELAYKLMFTDSDFLKEFLEGKEKVKELSLGDWSEEDHPTREMHYIKPLNGSIGPKETLCNIDDVNENADPEGHYTTVTTTQTPGVPSGNDFSVKTRTVITWSEGGAAHVRVTTEVEWTKVNRMLRGIIEKSCTEGQKSYHSDLATAIREKIKSDPATYAVAGKEPEKSPQDDVAHHESFFEMPDLSLPVVILGVLLVFLLITNIWTLIALRHQARAAHELRLGSPGEVAERVRRALGDFEGVYAGAAKKVGAEARREAGLKEIAELARSLERQARDLGAKVAGI